VLSSVLVRTFCGIPQQKEKTMSVVKRAVADLEWPAWLTTRNILDFPESWFDSRGEAAIRVEEFEDGNQMVVRAELPGVNPDEDIEMTVSDGSLCIKVQRRKETTHETKRHYRSEFQYGSYTRTLPLPAGATDTDVKAKYTDGVLEVRIPINGKQAESKKVAISRN
jgi:HSP20 family protein